MTWSDFDASMYCGVTLSLLDLFDVSDWSMLIIVEIGFDFSLCLYITACSCLDSLCKHYSHTESIDALNTTLWLKLTDWAEVLTHHVYFKIDKRNFFFWTAALYWCRIAVNVSWFIDPMTFQNCLFLGKLIQVPPDAVLKKRQRDFVSWSEVIWGLLINEKHFYVQEQCCTHPVFGEV